MRIVAFAAGVALLSTAGTALAEKPLDPGGFGQDRAAYIQGALLDDTAPGASEVGGILSDRAGENGTINNEYKCANGQVPDTASFCD